MIQSKRSNEHIDPRTLSSFIDGEMHVGEEERIRQHMKNCRLCALYVFSAKELKRAIARAGLRFAPCLTPTAEANHVGKGNLVCLESQVTLRAAVNRLQPSLREVLLLCDEEELSYGDIALILDIPINTVMSRISDARDTLCQLLILQLGKSQ
jgi:Sigma-70, region 4